MKRKTDTTKCDAGYVSENLYLVISSYYMFSSNFEAATAHKFPANRVPWQH